MKKVCQKRIYRSLVFLIWVCLIGFLIKENYFSPDSTVKFSTLETGIKNISSDAEWMIIKQNGTPIGYSVFSILNRGPNGYRFISQMHIKAALAGLVTQISIQNSVRVDTLFHLNNFHFFIISDPYTTEISGEVTGKELALTVIRGGDSLNQVVSVPENLYTHLGIQPLLAWRGIQPGEVIEFSVYDPVSKEMGTVTATHKGREKRIIGNETLELNKIRIDFGGIPTMIWLDESGITWREESLLGLVRERTTPEVALEMMGTIRGLDLLNAYAVPVKGRIEDPSALKQLTLEITGIDPEIMLRQQSSRQKVIQTYPLQIQLKPVLTLNGSDSLLKYLTGSSILETADPAVLKQVKVLKEKSRDNVRLIANMTKWVYDYLDKRPVVNLASASEILKERQGDCSEHTVLFTTLARSAGIPTKIQIGLVYLNGKFYYHAWPAVWNGQGWKAVDPTLGQETADATHITILENDFTRLTDLIPILGQIQIQIIQEHY